MAKKKNKPIVLDESPIINEDITNIENDKIESNEEVKVIDFNNNPVNLKAVGDFTAPRGFVPLAVKSNIGDMGCINNRPYQVIGKDLAVWCDNGKQFVLSKYVEELR